MNILKVLLVFTIFCFIKLDSTLLAQERNTFSNQELDLTKNHSEIMNNSIEPLMGNERFIFDARFSVNRWWVVPITFTTRNPGLKVYSTNNRSTTYKIGVGTYSASTAGWGVSYNMWQTFGSGYHVKYYSGLKAGTNYRLVVKGSGSGVLGAIDWGPSH